MTGFIPQGFGDGRLIAGVSTGGNTLGTTGTVNKQMILVGGNNITLSQSSVAGGSATVTISGATTNSILFVGGNNITLSGSTNGASQTITISAFNQSTNYVSYMKVGGDNGTHVIGGSEANFSHFSFPFNISATRADLYVSLTGNSNSSGAFTVNIGIYRITGSTATMASSALISFSYTSGSETSGTNNYGGQSGFRFRTGTIGTWNITPGEYLIGVEKDTTNNGTINFVGRTAPTNLAIGGVLDTNRGWIDGVYTTDATSLMTSLHVTDITPHGGGGMRFPYIVFLGTY